LKVQVSGVPVAWKHWKQARGRGIDIKLIPSIDFGPTKGTLKHLIRSILQTGYSIETVSFLTYGRAYEEAIRDPYVSDPNATAQNPATPQPNPVIPQTPGLPCLDRGSSTTDLSRLRYSWVWVPKTMAQSHSECGDQPSQPMILAPAHVYKWCCSP
jgi:hypothetical protein